METIDQFVKLRENFLKKQNQMRYPGMEFSEKEILANDIFIKLRDHSI